MSDINIKQNNLLGKNEVNLIYKISIDVGRLQEIVQSDSQNIKKLLDTLVDDSQEGKTDNDSIEVKDKNLKNELVEFYNEFIIREESKFEVLEKFIADNELYEQIDRASANLKRVIFSYKSKNNHKLPPELFSTLIEEHTKGLKSDDKDIITLLLYFLYRECFIGEK